MDAVAPPPTAPPRTAGAGPVLLPPSADGRSASVLGRVAAVVALGAGLLAVAVAGVGTAAPLALVPAVGTALLGGGSLAAGAVALAASRLRSLEAAALSAAGAASTVVAAVVTAASLLFPFGLPPLGDVGVSSAGAAGAPPRPADEVLADLHARSVPLGETVSMEEREVAVVAVLSDPADVAARLAETEWLAEDVGEREDVVLVELEAPVDGGGWVPVLDRGDVSVITAGGLPYRALVTRGSATYDVDGLVEASPDGLPRGRLVVAVAMPPDGAAGGMVVVTSPSWTEVATWSVPSW